MSNMPNKLLFVIPSLGQGGAERVLSILANEMADRGYEIVIALVLSDAIAYPLSEKVKTIYLHNDGINKLSGIERIGKRLNSIRMVIKQQKPNTIISFLSENSIDVCVASVGIHVPLIVSERNDPAIDPKSRLKRWIRKVAYLRADRFVFQTDSACAYFSRSIQRKSDIILNPLSGSLPDCFTGKREYKIVAVGRLNPQKNYCMLLEAFAEFHKEYQDYILQIYGDGEQKEYLQQLCLEYKIPDVEFMGFHKNIHDKIVSASMYILSSDFEGLPNSLIEAMALGIPCISTDCRGGGPASLIINQVNGLLVPVGAVEQLVSAMKFYASNPERANAIGNEASKIRKVVNKDCIVDKWIDCINSAVDSVREFRV